jgi:HEAT repeat protein
MAEALNIARQRAKENHSFDVEVAQFLNAQWMATRVDMVAVERALEILGAIAPPGRLFGVLRAAMAQNDLAILSKAALALARHVDNVPVLEKLMTNPDSRVRANTIEALWGRKLDDLEPLLITALADRHHRVAINAAYGLYLLDPYKYIGEVEQFVNHPKAVHRAGAAWLIRKIGDPKYLPMLKDLVRDQSAEVRKAAFKTLALLRAA